MPMRLIVYSLILFFVTGNGYAVTLKGVSWRNCLFEKFQTEEENAVIESILDAEATIPLPDLKNIPQEKRAKYLSFLRVIFGPIVDGKLKIRPSSFTPKGQMNFSMPYVVGNDYRFLGLDLKPVYGLAMRLGSKADYDAGFNLFLRVLGEGVLRGLRKDSVGAALHIESQDNAPTVFWIFSGERLKENLANVWVPDAFKNVQSTFLKFVFEVYRERLHLSEEAISKLRLVSDQTKDRTFYFLHSVESWLALRKPTDAEIRSGDIEEPDFEYRHNFGPVGPDFKKYENPKDFSPNYRPYGKELTLIAAVAVVVSTSIKDLLPLEILGNFRLLRKPGELSIEIGRRATKKGASVNERAELEFVSPEMMRQMVMAIVGKYGKKAVNGKVYAEIDEAHFRIWEPLGFKVIRSQKSGYDGRVDYVVEANISDIVKNTLISVDKARHPKEGTSP